MAGPWDFLLGRGRSSERVTVSDAGSSQPAAEADAPEAQPLPPLQKLGEQSELLHVRFSYMADRLDDLKSLSDDFVLLSKPIEEIATELPKAKSRILEIEALLARESDERARLQKDFSVTSEKHSTLTNDFIVLFNQNKANEETLDQFHSTAAEDRVRIAELTKLLNNTENQLTGEVENRKRLDIEVAQLAESVSLKSSQVQKLEDYAMRQADRNVGLEKEVARFQGVVDKQVLERVELQTRLNEVERVAQEKHRDVTDLQSRLEAEQAARLNRDHAHDLAVSALSAERSSLALKIEALMSRIGSADQTVSQTRAQLSERDSAIRTAEETLRTAEKQRESVERQVSILEHRMNAQANELADSQRMTEGLAKRCDMLTKALSAKEAALAGAMEKARTRSERVEELTKEFERERAAMDASHRRLVEELENERAERTLAQGALKIARESRASLQRLNESLKRANRSIQPQSPGEFDDRPPAPQSNVLPLQTKTYPENE